MNIYEATNLQLFGNVGDWGGRENEARDLMIAKFCEMYNEEEGLSIRDLAEEIWEEACSSDGKSIGYIP